MAVGGLLLLFLSLSVVEVHSQQTFPYVSFMGQTLANHSYVDLSLVGYDVSGSDSVQCHTDLTTCCSGHQGINRGDWYFPETTRLPFLGDIFEQRVAQRVDLRRVSGTSPTGLFHCDIPTDTVYSNTDISVRDTVYVGLYTTSGGNITITGGVYNYFLGILTCISTGGPATTVTWTRDSATVTGGTETVLNDPVTAQYTHTLTVTAAGLYICNVSNNKPSSASARLTVPGSSAPTNVTAVQDGATSIRVSWTPPSPLGNTTGYTISNTGGGSSDSVTVAGGSTNSLLLTGLTNGGTYTIYIAGTSSTGLPSALVEAAPVGLVPSATVLSSTSAVTATTITITGRIPSGSVVNGFLVEWQRNTSVGCSDEDEERITVNGGLTSYRVTGLEPGNKYTMTVRAFNAAGIGPLSNVVSAMTEEVVPSAPPSSVRRVTTTPNSITVQWQEVTCLHRNGAITGYVVHVVRVRRVEGATEVSGDARQATVSGLTPSTRYTVQVAAVNNVSTGPYSQGISLQTEATIVGLEEALHTISEADEVVEICVNAMAVNTACPSTDPFQVSLSTADQTAGNSTDYGAVEEVLTFASCETQHCVNVSITDDLINEPEERFSVSLTQSANTPSFITLGLVGRDVVITDDDDRPADVGFQEESSTAVRVSWSGSVHLSTCVQYTVYCSTTASIMAQYETVYPPHVTSAVVALDDDITLTDTYVHNFTFYYIMQNDLPGPLTIAIFTFDKKFIQIQFGPFHHCLDWGLEKIARIENQLQTYLIQIIRKSCQECFGLTPSFLRPGLFLCHKNPLNTTHRTTLVNPYSTTTAIQLVGIIQIWVSTGPSLILDGLLVRVSPACPTAISNLDQEECESGVRSDPALGQRITQTLNVCAVRELGEQICGG